MRDVVYLVSPAGNPNFGDEAILAGWLRFLARARPDADVLLDCPHPASALALFDGMHPNFGVTDALWRTCARSPRQDAAGVWTYVESLVRSGTETDFEPLTRAASIHLIGGGYINAVWPHQTGVVSGMAAARHFTGAALYGTGLGLLPACPDLPQLGSALQRFDHISCRDRSSAEWFGLPAGVDDIFLGMMTGFPPLATRQHGSRDVMVCVQNDLIRPESFARAAALLKERIQTCLDEGKTVGYVEALPGSDRRMFEALEGLLSEADLVSFPELWNSGFPARAGQHWYTSRFHLHLSAAACGAAGTALGVAPGYYDVMHRSLQELGTGWLYAGLESPGDLPHPAANPSFPDQCRGHAAAKQAEAMSLYGLSGSSGRYGDARDTVGQPIPAREHIFAEAEVRTVDAR